MAINWTPFDHKKIEPVRLLEFRNRVSGIDSDPDDLEIKALEMLLEESEKDETLYNLVSIDGDEIRAWVSGKFSPLRLTDMIRTFFFDFEALGAQGVDDLLYHLELGLPYPYSRIEIYGMGPGRERDLQIVTESGYSEAFDIVHYQRVLGANIPVITPQNVRFVHDIDPGTAYIVYRDAFADSWDLDQTGIEDFRKILEVSDNRFTFICENENQSAGLVITNKGLTDEDVYLQIIGVSKDAKGQGVGDTMMRYLVEQLDLNCIRTIALSTYEKNIPMRNLLRRWVFIEQFRETVLYKEDFKIPEDYVPHLSNVK